MTFSRRERLIAIVLGAVVILLVLDQMVLTPWFAAREDVQFRLADQRQVLDIGEQVRDNDLRARRRWAELSRGNLPRDASTAEGELLNALRDWGQASGLSLTVLRPDRAASSHDFQRISVRATGVGRMEQVTRFLWHLETATMPVRMSDLQINSRRPGVDDLSVQLTVTTIYLPPAPPETDGRRLTP